MYSAKSVTIIAIRISFVRAYLFLMLPLVHVVFVALLTESTDFTPFIKPYIYLPKVYAI